jgi:hypothetical protein
MCKLKNNNIFLLRIIHEIKTVKNCKYETHNICDDKKGKNIFRLQTEYGMTSIKFLIRENVSCIMHVLFTKEVCIKILHTWWCLSKQ